MRRHPALKWFMLDCGTRDAVASGGLLVLRVVAGLMMLFGHGIEKLRTFETMKLKFQAPDLFPLSLLSPQANLMLLIGAEVVAAGLLVAGLMTRPAAFVLGFAMVVAAFCMHGGRSFSAMEPALLYLLPSVVLLLTGAGAWSLDAVLYRESKQKYW